MKFLIIFIYLITTGFGHAIDKPNIKNLVLIKTPKTYEEVIFKDKNQKDVNLADYKGKLLV
ncbi:TlpA family protein disulfide reductase, partial [Candidatus Pelagibacter sp.]|nr:TlpA family protein disulfide reductase [Candidatus Pelagibacter sp.]